MVVTASLRGLTHSAKATQYLPIPLESPRCLLSNDIKFAQIGVRTEELWLPEVGSSELFLCVFPAKIPVKRGMLPANREFHVVAGVVIFPTHPGLHVNLQRFARVFDLAPDVGFRRSWYRRKACTAYFFKVPDLQESELGFVRYGPANRGHRGVFGPLEDIFPIGIPARPGKILAIREFHVVHGCVFFPTCLGLWINLLRVKEDSARKRGNVGGKIPEFSA
uniref:Uncharacterized protein n=1 Tax=Fagus sylvatica TaxID=28930 RepID=A0A2N9GLB7_FAGSY